MDRKEIENMERIEQQKVQVQEESVSTPVVKPRKNKIHKQPVETYEFEYDENDGEEDYTDDENE